MQRKSNTNEIKRARKKKWGAFSDNLNGMRLKTWCMTKYTFLTFKVIQPSASNDFASVFLNEKHFIASNHPTKQYPTADHSTDIFDMKLNILKCASHDLWNVFCSVRRTFELEIKRAHDLDVCKHWMSEHLSCWEREREKIKICTYINCLLYLYFQIYVHGQIFTANK